MSSLADLPEIIGFFSYSREDDESFKGSLSALREGIQRELSAQLGRSKRTFRLWQDQEAIAPGTLWETEISSAVAQSIFFVPIVTPRAVNSEHCRFEYETFLVRERALGRADLVFPILYIAVPALDDEAQWRNHPVLSIIGKRQYVDWRQFRHHDVQGTAVREAIERFCQKIVAALTQSWLSPEERRRQDETETARLAKNEAARQRAEAERAAVDGRRTAAEAERRAQKKPPDPYPGGERPQTVGEERPVGEPRAKMRSTQEQGSSHFAKSVLIAVLVTVALIALVAAISSY